VTREFLKKIIMKNIITELVFDKEIVAKLKEANINREYMYNLLYAGKITLQEYLDAGK
jgi:hypothetical protein